MANLPIDDNLANELDPDGEVSRILLGEDPQDTIDFCETYLTIDNEYGHIVPVRLYPQQIMMVHEATGRDITVKGRQTRSSSIKMMAWLRRLVFQRTGARCIMGAQDDQTVKLFRAKIKHFMADLQTAGFAFQMGDDNEDEMVFRDTENRIQFVSGEQRIMGRAFAAQEVHLSELAHWKPATVDKLLGGLLPSVPAAPRGHVDFESTPAGEAGAFYKYAMDARPLSPNPDAEFTVHFYPWWLEPRYTTTDDPSADGIVLASARLADLKANFKPSPEEQRLVEQGLSVNQLLWRRLRMAEQNKTAAPFSQEYPEDILKCWLGTAGRFFDTADEEDHLDYYRKEERKPFKQLERLSYKGSEVSFYGRHLLVWEDPIIGQAYVVAFDAAGGGQGDSYDWTSIGVWNATKEKRVAELLIQCTPSQAGAMVAAIGEYYCNALVGGESSHHGAGVFDKLRELAYENLYYHVDGEHPLPKDKAPTPGIYPTAVMRGKILEKFREAVVDHAMQSYSAKLNQQMAMFTWEKFRDRLKAQAERKVGSHDDVVMEAANGWWLCAVARMRFMVARGRRQATATDLVQRGNLVGTFSTPWDGRKTWLR